MKKLLIVLSLGLLIVGATGSSRLVKHLAEEGVEVDGVRLKHRRTVEMTVELIAPIAMDEQLRFAIREGGRTVGAGVVTKILE